MQISEELNERIVKDVLSCVELGRTPLVLTERYDHAKLLTSCLKENGQRVILLSGKGTAKEKGKYCRNCLRLRHLNH